MTFIALLQGRAVPQASPRMRRCEAVCPPSAPRNDSPAAVGSSGAFQFGEPICSNAQTPNRVAGRCTSDEASPCRRRCGEGAVTSPNPSHTLPFLSAGGEGRRGLGWGWVR